MFGITAPLALIELRTPPFPPHPAMSGVEVASIGALVAVGTAVDVIRRTGGLGDLLSSTGSVAFGVGLGLAVGAAVASSLQQTPGKLEISADASTAEKLAIPSPSPASAPASISITVGDDDASAGHDEHTELQSQALPSRAASRRRSSLESLANQPCVASTELERCISMVDVALSQARPGSKVIPTLESVLKLLRRRTSPYSVPLPRFLASSHPMFCVPTSCPFSTQLRPFAFAFGFLCTQFLPAHAG